VKLYLFPFQGNAKTIKSISAVSKLNTTKVLIFPIAAFKEYLIKHQEYLVASIIRLMERSYRLQYQILHLAWHLTNSITAKDREPLHAPPPVLVPPSGEALSPTVLKYSLQLLLLHKLQWFIGVAKNITYGQITDNALRSFMEFLGVDDFNFFKEHCEIEVLEPEEPSSDLTVIRSSRLNGSVSTLHQGIVYVNVHNMT